MSSLILLGILTGSGTVIQINYNTFDSNIFTNTSYTVQQLGLKFSINESLGWIAILIGILTVATMAGFQFLGSGLSDSASHILISLAFYVGFWLILTVFAYPLLESIKIYGLFIFFILTLMYLYGVGVKLTL